MWLWICRWRWAATVKRCQWWKQKYDAAELRERRGEG